MYSMTKIALYCASNNISKKDMHAMVTMATVLNIAEKRNISQSIDDLFPRPELNGVLKVITPNLAIEASQELNKDKVYRQKIYDELVNYITQIE